jgi:hypothetical protein
MIIVFMTRRVPSFLLVAPQIVLLHACMMHRYRHWHHQPMNRLTLPAMDMVEFYGRPQVTVLAISHMLTWNTVVLRIPLANVIVIHFGSYRPWLHMFVTIVDTIIFKTCSYVFTTVGASGQENHAICSFVSYGPCRLFSDILVCGLCVCSCSDGDVQLRTCMLICFNYSWWE